MIIIVIKQYEYCLIKENEMVKKLRILFRTAGGSAKNKELGTGHIFRCINLANQLRKHEIFFVVEDFGGVEKILCDNNFIKITILKQNISLKEDIIQTTKIIKKYKIDLVIVDKINTKKTFLEKLKINAFTVYISDLKKIEYPSHLIINGFVGLKNSIIHNKYKSKCLLGPHYQILAKSNLKKNKIKKKYDLLVTFGGYDANNIIDKFCYELEKFSDKLRVKIIIGISTKKTSYIRKIEKFSNSIEIINFTKNLQREIHKSKFGLCSGGITTYEFASAKIPFAIICQYPHQKLTAKEWEKRGYAINLGTVDKKLPIKINKFLSNLIQNKIKISIDQSITDRMGGKRVANFILKSYYQDRLKKRK